MIGHREDERMAKFKNLLYKKEQPVAIKHIMRPEWLEGVTITKYSDCFKVSFRDGVSQVIVEKEPQFKSVHKSMGDWHRGSINSFGECTLDFSTTINGLDTCLCFSLDKYILLHRIKEQGDSKGIFLQKFDEKSDRGIYICKRGDGAVALHYEFDIDESIVVGTMLVCISTAPEYLTKRFGKPSVVLNLKKSKGYKKNKSVKIDRIVFTWGDSTVKYGVILTIDVTFKKLGLDIIVR